MSHFYTRASYTRLTEELNRLRSEELPSVSRAKQDRIAGAEVTRITARRDPGSVPEGDRQEFHIRPRILCDPVDRI